MANTLKLHYKGILLAMGLAALFALAISPDVSASFLPLPDNRDLDVASPGGDTALEKFENLLGPIGRVLRIIVGAIAVMLIVISGLIMVVSGDNEETVKTEKKSMTYGIIGLMMISIAGPIAEVFDFRSGNYVDSPDLLVEKVALFDDTTRIVITFIKYLLGSLASLTFIRAGAAMITGSENEDDVTREKKNLVMGAAGLGLVLVSELVIRNIFYVTEFNTDSETTTIAIDQTEFITQVVGVTNLIVTFVGPVMMLGIVIGAVMYITAGGDEERSGLAKKILMNSVIGIVVIYGAFALVSTIISGTF